MTGFAARRGQTNDAEKGRLRTCVRCSIIALSRIFYLLKSPLKTHLRRPARERR